MTSVERVWEAARALEHAVASREFAGWDPYDALSSPLLAGVARTPLLRRIAIQSLKRSPVNVRPLLGVRRQPHTKGLALFASAFARLAALDSDSTYGERARELAERVAARALQRPAGVGWGYDFDVQTRWGYYRRGQPNAVVTAFCAQALLDVAALGPGAERLRALARDATAYATAELLVRDGDQCFFAYFGGSRVAIHNASLLVAGLCSRCSARGSDAWTAAESAVRYSLVRQRPDSTWPYGEGRGLGWVDGFHTAYVLDALADWAERASDQHAAAAVRSGLDAYMGRLIDPDGAPRASLSSRHPLDIHAAASAISTLSRLSAYDQGSLAAASSVLTWTLEHMRRGDGRFAFQRHRFHRNAVPYVRWSDAHMMLALASYLAADNASDHG